ncbi:GntR family transcriptional regulator [Deinococcus alpinitundrae]|uniref:GntR family transcriptional regulator n=1 Tax=Deinococcus alpinitundrae TaxID=468913 RepID=UPI001379E453|nr:GntR family transcriptional regulator [Deinococcus alpinitundrae]
MSKGRTTDKQTEADEAYAVMRQSILGGGLMPGERLVETELAERLGLGRNAVRTSLARLEQDGLVERSPFRGARVRIISEAEAAEILEARSVLEGLAARHAAEYMTPEQVQELRGLLGQMEQQHQAGDLLATSELNSVLHRRIVELAALPMVAKLIDGLHAQNVRHQFRTVLAPGRAAQSLAEHRAIVDALATGDGELAEAAMRHHLAHVLRTLRSLQKNTTRS